MEWIHPIHPLAHPLADGTAVVLDRSVAQTGEGLGQDAGAYQRLMDPLVADWEKILHEFLGPLRIPQHPIAMARFGLVAPWPARLLAETLFREERARALFGGLAAHSIQPLERPPTAAFGLMLAMLAHAVGWPMPTGGSQAIANVLVAYLQSLGGEVVTGARVDNVDELPPARAVLLDLTPKQIIKIAGHKLPQGYRQALERYRYGPGVFKLDFALSEPIPWKAADCRKAATVHLGGTLAEVAASERAIWRGEDAQWP